MFRLVGDSRNKYMGSIFNRLSLYKNNLALYNLFNINQSSQSINILLTRNVVE